MATIKFTLNGKAQSLEADSEMPLLWALRDLLNMTGTKYGCGVGVCGSCTVLVNGKAERSCSVSCGDIANKKVVTIEGLSEKGDHPLQKAWVEVDVPQCGYCQAGQILQAAALLMEKKNPTDADIDKAMDNNICRCGTYRRIKKAIKVAAGGGVQ